MISVDISGMPIPHMGYDTDVQFMNYSIKSSSISSSSGVLW